MGPVLAASQDVVLRLFDWASVTGAFILLPIVAFPTLDFFSTRGDLQQQREYTVWLENNMCFSPRNVREGRWWCVPLASYVHKNDTHKLNNLAALLWPSLIVHEELGEY
jgi:hypothetical protein